MASILPNELIDKVVEEIALQPGEDTLQDLIACSTVNSIFTPLCQKHIFRKILIFTLPSPTDEREGAHDLHRRTKALVGALARNPRLVPYIKDIYYEVLGLEDGDETLPDVLAILGSVPSGVEMFTLQGGRQHGLNPEQDPKWVLTMFALLDCLKISRLGLEDVYVPVEVIPSSVTRLKLTKACISDVGEGGQAEDLPQERRIALRALSFDLIYPIVTSAHGSILDVSQIEELEMGDHILVYDSLLTPMVQVRTLTINATTYIDVEGGYSEPSIPNTIRKLNPSSFSTLSHLSLDQVFYFEDEGPAIIDDPYGYICGPPSILTQLIALQDLDITIKLAGVLTLCDGNYGSQWSRLPDLLGNAGVLPLLKRVGIRVYVQLPIPEEYANTYPCTDQEANDLAQAILDNLATFVYPSQFQSLHHIRAESGHPIELSFSAQVADLSL